MGLSLEQMKIVHHPIDKHAVVLAVAGSGKSTTMAERNAYLVEAKRINPQHILNVMFNKAASLELEEKLQHRLGKRNAPISVTYHRLGTLTLNRLMKEGLAEAWGFEASPSKAQHFTAKVIEATCFKYGHKYPRIIADVFLGFVDRVKGDLSTAAKTWDLGEWDARYEWFIGMYAIYEKVRAKEKKRFFSDLIYDPIAIMRNDELAARIIADRYRHIIVDEYQDICESQQALVRYVAGNETRVMVVGDDDQTIYTWRGAKPAYILRDFERDFPGAVKYHLTRTWRYGHALSCAANYVITHNSDRAEKLCISGENAPSTSLNLEWEVGDGSTLLKIVEKWVEDGGSISDIAILVRAYSKSGSSQFALLQAGVPFRLEGGEDVSVLDNKWVSALIGWMFLTAGHVAARPYAGDPDSGSIYKLKKILDTPSIGLSYEGANELAVSVLRQPEGTEGFAGFVGRRLAISDGQLSEKVYLRGKLWRKYRSMAKQNVDPFDLVEQLIFDLDLKKAISKAAPNADVAEDQCALVDAFVAYVQAHGQGRELQVFLRHIDDLRTFSERAKLSTEALHMTSVHRAKGLEWPCVIMIGLAQGSFPIKPKRKLDELKGALHLEDERRLFYVGLTRARKALYLLAPPDALLHQWLRAGRSGAPDGMKTDGLWASQFIYESNLYLARSMPHMVNRHLDLKAGSPEVYNDYLEALGIDRRVGKLND